jgi:hypothetical protein
MGTNSSQSDISISDELPVVMVETVAPSSMRIAPGEAQSSTLSMIRFGKRKMMNVMKHISEMKGRFLAMETELYAMTLTPPRASGRAAGSRLAWPLVAQPDGKTTDELNAIG